MFLPSGAEVYHDRSWRTNEQIITDPDGEADVVEDQMARELEGIVKEQMAKELFDSLSGVEVSHDHSRRIHEQVIAYSGEEVDAIKEQFGGRVALTSPDGSRVFSLERLVGSGSPSRIVKPAPLSETIVDVVKNDLNEEDTVIEKIQKRAVKFLRLVQRLGQSPEDSIVARVLHRLVVNQEF